MTVFCVKASSGTRVLLEQTVVGRGGVGEGVHSVKVTCHFYIRTGLQANPRGLSVKMQSHQTFLTLHINIYKCSARNSSFLSFIFCVVRFVGLNRPEQSLGL